MRIVGSAVLGVLVDERRHLLGGGVLEMIEEDRDVGLSDLTELDRVVRHQSNSSTTDAISRFWSSASLSSISTSPSFIETLTR